MYRTSGSKNWRPATASSPTSPLSPLSPTISGLQAKLRNRVPTQLRRSVPLYLLCLVLFFLVLNADIFTVSPAKPVVFKRQSSQTVLGGSIAPSARADFPKKIWQTWKTDPYHFAKRDLKTAQSWTTKNPGYRYEVLTDNNDMMFVEQHFGPGGLNRPDIVNMYREINTTIIKADLLRYMIMYAEGGVYADIDVEALRTVDRYVPARYNAGDIDMVIGVEIDQPEFRDHPILGKKSASFCQWTFMCKPRLPVMLQLIENIMGWLSGIAAQQNVHISEVVLDFDEVIGGTGPSAFTAAVLKEMNKLVRDGKKITWDDFHGMDESRLVSRVLVLDVEAFAAGQGHSDSGNHNSRSALVKHHYHASNWPSKHPRFSHPAYGEVERCNWDVACVKKWDTDVETFKTLSPEEQQRKIMERKAQQVILLEEAKKQQEEAIKLESFVQAMNKAGEDAIKKAAEDSKHPAQGSLFGFPQGPAPAPALAPAPASAPAPAPEPAAAAPPVLPAQQPLVAVPPPGPVDQVNQPK